MTLIGRFCFLACSALAPSLGHQIATLWPRDLRLVAKSIATISPPPRCELASAWIMRGWLLVFIVKAMVFEIDDSLLRKEQFYPQTANWPVLGNAGCRFSKRPTE